MADPISLLGTVVSVASAVASLSFTIYRLTSNVSDVPQTLREFNSEITRFEQLLDQIKRILNERAKSKNGQDQLKPIQELLKLLRSCEGYFIELDKRFPQRHDNNSNQISMTKKLKFVVQEDSFKSARSHIQMVCQIVDLHLQKIVV